MAAGVDVIEEAICDELALATPETKGIEFRQVSLALIKFAQVLL